MNYIYIHSLINNGRYNKMPKAFTESEKKTLKKKLLNSAENLFKRYGLKKTTIKDLTQAVAISQGAFYSFFDSKEELYYSIL